MGDQGLRSWVDVLEMDPDSFSVDIRAIADCLQNVQKNKFVGLFVVGAVDLLSVSAADLRRVFAAVKNHSQLPRPPSLSPAHTQVHRPSYVLFC